MTPSNNSTLTQSIVMVHRRIPNRPAAPITPYEAWFSFVGLLETEKFTGRIVVDMHCGGIRKIEAEDQKPLPS